MLQNVICGLQTSLCRWIRPSSCLETGVALCCNPPTCGTISLTPLTRAVCVGLSLCLSPSRFVPIQVPDAINPYFDLAANMCVAFTLCKMLMLHHDENMYVYKKPRFGYEMFYTYLIRSPAGFHIATNRWSVPVVWKALIGCLSLWPVTLFYK